MTSAEAPAAMPALPAAAAPSPASGLPPVAASAADSGVAATPFDVALQACLIDLPNAEGVAEDSPQVRKGRGEGDDLATTPAADAAPSSVAQGMPVLLMTLLPVSPPVPQATPEVATADLAATLTLIPPGLSRPAASPDSGVVQGGANRLSGGATPTAADGVVPPQPMSVSVGDGGSTPLLAAALLAGQGGARPLPSAARVAPAQVGVPLQAVQPSATLATSGAGVAQPDPLPAAAMAAAPLAGSVTGEAGRAPQADGVDRALLTTALPVAAADAGAARSPDASLRLPNGEASQWRQPLMQALGERLQYATERGIDSAVIRLEPPRMGSIEIAIRHQDGALQINLSATHNEVLRQLQDISETLRHSLGQRHAGDVSVQVADTVSSRPGQGDGERQRQRQAQSEQNPGRGLGDTENDGGRPSFSLARNEE